MGMGHFPSAWEMNIQNHQQFCHSNQSTWVLIHSHVGFLENWVRKNLMTYQDILGYNGHSVGIFHFQTNPYVVTAWLISKQFLYRSVQYIFFDSPNDWPLSTRFEMGYVTIIESIINHHWLNYSLTCSNHDQPYLGVWKWAYRPSRNWVDLWHPEDKLCLQGMLMMNHLYIQNAFLKKCIHPNAFHFLSWNDESSIKARDIYTRIMMER